MSAVCDIYAQLMPDRHRSENENFEFITEKIRLQSIVFLRLLEIRVALFKCLGHFIENVYTHNFASKTRLIYFSPFPEIFV